MSLTRRDITKMVLACTALTASAAMPVSAADNRQWAQRLGKDLSRRLSRGCNGEFTVAGFGQAKRRDGRIHFRSAVKLDWPPGARCRLFDAIEADETAAYQALFQQVRDEFHKAWPDCVK